MAADLIGELGAIEQKNEESRAYARLSTGGREEKEDKCCDLSSCSIDIIRSQILTPQQIVFHNYLI